MNDEERGGGWADQQDVIWAAGLAALLLVALLVWAVVRTSTGSGEPGVGTAVPTSSSATSSATTLKTESSTSYAVPRVQTSEPTVLPSAPAPPGEVPPDVSPGGASPGEGSPQAPTTIYNPYATTTPPGSAGHV